MNPDDRSQFSDAAHNPPAMTYPQIYAPPHYPPYCMWPPPYPAPYPYSPVIMPNFTSPFHAPPSAPIPVAHSLAPAIPTEFRPPTAIPPKPAYPAPLPPTQPPRIVSFSSLRSLLPANNHPILLVFVNSKSGGQQGASLITQFKELLPGDQVIDIMDGGPRAALDKFKGDGPRLRILACGGDGTGKWILEELDKVFLTTEEQPPVATLPLGTGNDISRVLGWGGGYTNKPLFPLLEQLQAPTVSTCLLDRWALTITSTASATTRREVLNNYLSLGFVDAKISLEFHEKRENSPGMFFNRGLNKLWYVTYGVKTAVGDAVSTVAPAAVASPVRLEHCVRLEVDSVPVDIGTDIQGVIVLNIPSYGGGMNLWGCHGEEKYAQPSMSDGLIEVIGIRSAFHIGQIGTGMSTGVRLGQGRHIRIEYFAESTSLPCKVDGEPWLQREQAVFEITFHRQSRMLCRSGCPASKVAMATCMGWLKKLSSGSLKRTWQSRYFMLVGHTLYYYHTMQDTAPRGSIDLSPANGIALRGGKQPAQASDMAASKSYVFEIVTTARTYHLRADIERDAVQWIERISNNCGHLTVL